MNKDDIVQRVMNELTSLSQDNDKSQIVLPDSSSSAIAMVQPEIGSANVVPEFIGVNPLGNSIGMIIPRVDAALHKLMKLPENMHSIGILTSRNGYGPQILACDEAVKAANVDLVRFDIANDSNHGRNHGIIAVFAAEDVSDAKKAVEVALDALKWTFGGVNINEAGYVECQYSARASHALTRYMYAKSGQAWGLITALPGGIGIVIADTALKTADVKMTSGDFPGVASAFTNEFTIFVTGDSAAVKQSVIAAREAGKKLLRTMASEPQPCAEEYY